MNTWIKGHRILVKAISLAVTVVFMCTYVFNDAWAVLDARDVSFPEAKRYAVLDVETFNLPAHLGKIKGSYRGTSDKFIIHIQDAHANCFAQQKIAEIIGYLNEEYGIEMVNLEGGVGSYDLEVFTSILDEGVRKETSSYFVKNGQLNGAEFFAVNNPDKVTIWGVEDRELYLKNLKVYQDSLSYKEEVDKYLKELTHILNNLKRHIFTKELLRVDTAYSAYKKENIEFKEYLEFLTHQAEKRKILVEEFPNLHLLCRTVEIEDKVDFKKADIEKGQLIDELRKGLSKSEINRLVKKTIDFKTGMCSRREFYEHLLKDARELGLDVNRFSALVNYLEYVSTYESVDQDKVSEEIDNIEKAIREKLFRNDTQRELDVLSRNLALAKNIFSISLTKSDYEYYLKNDASFEMDNYMRFIDREAPKYRIAARPSSGIERLDDYREDISKFYEYSFMRDEVFMKNLKWSQAKDHKMQIAVLMSGGFHTGNLCSLLREEGISHISIIPKFRIEEGYECPYFDLLAGKPVQIEARFAEVLGFQLAIASMLNELGEDIPDGAKKKAIFDLHVKWKAAVESGQKGLLVKLGDETLGILDSEGRRIQTEDIEKLTPEDLGTFALANVTQIAPGLPLPEAAPPAEEAPAIAKVEEVSEEGPAIRFGESLRAMLIAGIPVLMGLALTFFTGVALTIAQAVILFFVFLVFKPYRGMEVEAVFEPLARGITLLALLGMIVAGANLLVPLASPFFLNLLYIWAIPSMLRTLIVHRRMREQSGDEETRILTPEDTLADAIDKFGRNMGPVVFLHELVHRIFLRRYTGITGTYSILGARPGGRVLEEVLAYSVEYVFAPFIILGSALYYVVRDSFRGLIRLVRGPPRVIPGRSSFLAASILRDLGFTEVPQSGITLKYAFSGSSRMEGLIDEMVVADANYPFILERIFTLIEELQKNEVYKATLEQEKEKYKSFADALESQRRDFVYTIGEPRKEPIISKEDRLEPLVDGIINVTDRLRERIWISSFLFALADKGVITEANIPQVKALINTVNAVIPGRITPAFQGIAYEALTALAEAGAITQDNITHIKNVFIVIADNTDAYTGAAFTALRDLAKAGKITKDNIDRLRALLTMRSTDEEEIVQDVAKIGRREDRPLEASHRSGNISGLVERQKAGIRIREDFMLGARRRLGIGYENIVPANINIAPELIAAFNFPEIQPIGEFGALEEPVEPELPMVQPMVPFGVQQPHGGLLVLDPMIAIMIVAVIIKTILGDTLKFYGNIFKRIGGFFYSIYLEVRHLITSPSIGKTYAKGFWSDAYPALARLGETGNPLLADPRLISDIVKAAKRNTDAACSALIALNNTIGVTEENIKKIKAFITAISKRADRPTGRDELEIEKARFLGELEETEYPDIIEQAKKEDTIRIAYKDLVLALERAKGKGISLDFDALIDITKGTGIHAGAAYLAYVALAEAGISPKKTRDILVTVARRAGYATVNAYSMLEKLARGGVVTEDNIDWVRDFSVTTGKKTPKDPKTRLALYSVLDIMAENGLVNKDNIEEIWSLLFSTIFEEAGVGAEAAYSALEAMVRVRMVTIDNMKKVQDLFSVIGSKTTERAIKASLASKYASEKWLLQRDLEAPYHALKALAEVSTGDNIDEIRNFLSEIPDEIDYDYLNIIYEAIINMTVDVSRERVLPRAELLPAIIIYYQGFLKPLLAEVKEGREYLQKKGYLTQFSESVRLYLSSMKFDNTDEFLQECKDIMILLARTSINMNLCLDSLKLLKLRIKDVRELISALPYSNALTRVIRMLGERSGFVGGHSDLIEVLRSAGNFNYLYDIILEIAQKKGRGAPVEIEGVLRILEEYREEGIIEEWDKEEWEAFRNDIALYYDKGLEVFSATLFSYFREHKDDDEKIESLRKDIQEEMAPFKTAWGSFKGLSEEFKRKYGLTPLDEVILIARYIPILNLTVSDYQEMYEKVRKALEEKPDYSDEIDPALRGVYKFDYGRASQTRYSEESGAVQEKQILLDELEPFFAEEIPLSEADEDNVLEYFLSVFIEQAGDTDSFRTLPDNLSSQEEYLRRWAQVLNAVYLDEVSYLDKTKEEIREILIGQISSLSGEDTEKLVERFVKVRFMPIEDIKRIFTPDSDFYKAVKENDTGALRNLIIMKWFSRISSSSLEDEDALRDWFQRGKGKFCRKVAKETGMDLEEVVPVMDKAFEEALADLRVNPPYSDAERRSGLLLPSIISLAEKKAKALSGRVGGVLDGFEVTSSQLENAYYVGLFDDLLHLMEFMMTGVCTWRNRAYQIKEGPHFSVIALKTGDGKLLGTSQVQILKTPVKGIDNPTSEKGYRVMALTGINLYQKGIPVEREKAFFSIIEAASRLAKKANVIPVIPANRGIRSNDPIVNKLIDELVNKGILEKRRLTEETELSVSPKYSYEEVYVINLPEEGFFLEETSLAEIRESMEEKEKRVAEKPIIVDDFIELSHEGRLTDEEAQMLSERISGVVAKFPQDVAENVKLSSQIFDISLRITVDPAVETSKIEKREVDGKPVIRLTIGGDIIYAKGKIETLTLSEMLSELFVASMLDDYNELKETKNTNENSFFKLELMKALINNENHLPLYYKSNVTALKSWTVPNYWEGISSEEKINMLKQSQQKLDGYIAGLKYNDIFQWNIFLNVMDDANPEVMATNYIHLLLSDPFMTQEEISKIIYLIQDLSVSDKVSLASLRNALKEFYFDGRVKIEAKRKEYEAAEKDFTDKFADFDNTDRFLRIKNTLLTTEDRDEFYKTFGELLKMILPLSTAAVNKEIRLLFDKDIFLLSEDARGEAIKAAIRDMLMRRLGRRAFSALAEHLTAKRGDKNIPYISMLEGELPEGGDADEYDFLREEEEDWVKKLFLMSSEKKPPTEPEEPFGFATTEWLEKWLDKRMPWMPQWVRRLVIAPLVEEPLYRGLPLLFASLIGSLVMGSFMGPSLVILIALFLQIPAAVLFVSHHKGIKAAPFVVSLINFVILMSVTSNPWAFMALAILSHSVINLGSKVTAAVSTFIFLLFVPISEVSAVDFIEEIISPDFVVRTYDNGDVATYNVVGEDSYINTLHEADGTRTVYDYDASWSLEETIVYTTDGGIVSIYPDETTKEWTPGQEFIRGVNLAWVRYGYDFGQGANGETYEGLATKKNQLYQKLEPWKGCTVRVFIFCDLRSGIIFDVDGTPLDINSQVYDDMDTLLEAAHALGINILPVLFDKTLADGVVSQYEGEHQDLITDPVKRSALFDLMGQFVSRYAEKIEIWDFMNEPSDVAKKTSITDGEVDTFVSEGIEMVHANDPGSTVTVGLNGADNVDRYTGVDSEQLHVYPGMSPPQYPDDAIPTGSSYFHGELDPGYFSDPTFANVIGIVYENGSSGALIWQDASYYITAEQIDFIRHWKETEVWTAPEERKVSSGCAVANWGSSAGTPILVPWFVAVMVIMIGRGQLRRRRYNATHMTPEGIVRGTAQGTSETLTSKGIVKRPVTVVKPETLAGGMIPEDLGRRAREEEAQWSIDYLKLTGMYYQVEIIREAISGDPGKLAEFNRLLELEGIYPTEELFKGIPKPGEKLFALDVLKQEDSIESLNIQIGENVTLDELFNLIINYSHVSEALSPEVAKFVRNMLDGRKSILKIRRVMEEAMNGQYKDKDDIETRIDEMVIGKEKFDTEEEIIVYTLEKQKDKFEAHKLIALISTLRLQVFPDDAQVITVETGEKTTLGELRQIGVLVPKYTASGTESVNSINVVTKDARGQAKVLEVSFVDTRIQEKPPAEMPPLANFWLFTDGELHVSEDEIFGDEGRIEALAWQIETERIIPNFYSLPVEINGVKVQIYIHKKVFERIQAQNMTLQGFIDRCIEIRGPKYQEKLKETLSKKKYLIVDALRQSPALYGNCKDDGYFGYMYMNIDADAPIEMDLIGFSHELMHEAGIYKELYDEMPAEEAKRKEEALLAEQDMQIMLDRGLNPVEIIEKLMPNIRTTLFMQKAFEGIVGSALGASVLSAIAETPQFDKILRGVIRDEIAKRMRLAEAKEDETTIVTREEVEETTVVTREEVKEEPVASDEELLRQIQIDLSYELYEFRPTRVASPEDEKVYDINTDRDEILKMMEEFNWYFRSYSADDKKAFEERTFGSFTEDIVERIKDFAVAQAKEAGLEIEKDDILAVITYGSYCWAEAVEPSDMDLAVVLKGSVPQSKRHFLGIPIKNPEEWFKGRRVEKSDMRLIGIEDLLKDPSQKDNDTLDFETAVQGHGVLLYGMNILRSPPLAHNLLVKLRQLIANAIMYSRGTVIGKKVYEDGTEVFAGLEPKDHLRKVERRVDEVERIFREAFSERHLGRIDREKAVRDITMAADTVDEIKSKIYELLEEREREGMSVSHEDVKALHVELEPLFDRLLRLSDSDDVQGGLVALEFDRRKELAAVPEAEETIVIALEEPAEEKKEIVDERIGTGRNALTDLRQNKMDIIILPGSDIYVAYQEDINRKSARKFRKDFGQETLPYGYDFKNLEPSLARLIKERILPAFYKSEDKDPRILFELPEGVDLRNIFERADLLEDYEKIKDLITVVTVENIPENGMIDNVMHIILSKGLLNYERFEKGVFGEGTRQGSEELKHLVDFLETLVEPGSIDFAKYAGNPRELINSILTGSIALRIRAIDFTDIEDWKDAREAVLISL